MQKELITWKLILESLNKAVPVILLYVTESKGSSPGRQGFFMAVTATSQISGSLGGGIMEHKFVELARKKLSENDHVASLHRQIHSKAASQNQSGMICSGEQTILVYRLKQNDENTVRRLVESLQHSKNGTLSLSLHAINFSDEIPSINFSLQGSNDDYLLAAKTGYKQQLFIIGAGHCSLALSKLMSDMDFYIKLYDNRPALNTLNQNHFVHEKIHLNDYAEVADHIQNGEGKFVVVMTNGYRDDDKALRALIHIRFEYLGVLGSKKKIEQLFASCIADGLSPELISRVYAPAGIPIMSQTPEEIAVSIAAEIISVKNALPK